MTNVFIPLARTPNLQSRVPVIERELLLAQFLGKDRTWVLAHPNEPLTPPQRDLFARLVQRLAQGVPLSYLTKVKEFYGRPFTIGPGVLVPRPETEHLIEEALNIIPERSTMTVADIGTGSGCIAVTLALERPNIRVIATDTSKRALHIARLNAQRHNVFHSIGFLRGNLLAPLLRRHLVPDLLVANLPYATPEEYLAVRAEPTSAIVGGDDGMTVFRAFFQQLRRSEITPRLVLEVDPRRTDNVITLAQTALPKAAISIQHDLAGRKRVVVVTPTASRD